jgi:hypothetical protein
LGNFVDLVSVFLGTQMLQMCRAETKRFMDEFKCCYELKRAHLFEVDLGFDKDGLLSLFNY